MENIFTNIYEKKHWGIIKIIIIKVVVDLEVL